MYGYGVSTSLKPGNQCPASISAARRWPEYLPVTRSFERELVVEADRRLLRQVRRSADGVDFVVVVGARRPASRFGSG